MSKIIKITPECIEEIRKDFEAALRGAKIADGKISFTKTFNYINRKAIVYFTEVAWMKMQTLIREFDKEVAWHGVATRGEDASKDEYYITDILVYPQEVTGATVNTDQEKYEMWLMQHDDDVFNNIRMQGHSHVNMSTSPSSVDTTHQEKILAQLEDDMFYIFMIWNKRGEKTIKIYDLAKNVLFDGIDVSVQIKDDGLGLEQFIKTAKDMVKDKVYTPYTSGSYNNGNGYGGNYGGNYNSGNYGGYGYHGGGHNSNYHESKQPSKDNKPSKEEPAKQGNTPSQKQKKKGKRKNKNTPRPVNACESKQLTIYDGDDMYGDYDPYGAFGYRENYWD